MKPTDKLVLLAELPDAICQLNHRGDPEGESPEAINYIVIPMTDGSEMTLAVCLECQIELTRGNSYEWYLHICLGCTESQWIHKLLSKRPYDTQVTFVRECIKCVSTETEETNA